MYEIINHNIGCILGNIDKDLDLRTYLTLLDRFSGVDVTCNTEFQKDYCLIWRLFGAGFSQDFRSGDFELMERLKGDSLLSI